eukprot:2693279-Alexandrium_andersonii.AAC.1
MPRPPSATSGSYTGRAARTSASWVTEEAWSPPHELASALTERLAQPVAVHEALGMDPASRAYIP